MRKLIRNLQVLLTLAVIAAPLAAQEGPVTLEFSFANPGARSMGFGGAFAALADDATAAFANPAGMVQLLEPEVSLEARLWAYDTPYVLGGRVSGEATGIGLDTTDGIRYGASFDDITGISFLSLVYPAERWSLAVYHHKWADFQLASQVDGLFGDIEDELERSEDLISRTSLKVVNSGLAGAYELTDSLSIGLGFVYYEAELTSYTDEYAYDEDDFFSANPHLPELLDTTYDLRSRGTGITVHAGLLWRPSLQWSFGAYFRQGPEMTIDLIETVGPADEDHPSGTIDKHVITPLQLPDVFGIGAAYRSKGGALTISLEWDRVRYSQISDDLDGKVYDQGQIKINDGDELHLGFEYLFLRTRPVLGLRLGIWHDPAHGLGAGPQADLFERTINYGGEDQLHYCGGIGLALKRFQLDLGFDLAETTDLASLSIVYRF